MFLSPGATGGEIPPQFAYPAALGDLIAAVLALVAIPAFWVPALLVTHYITFIMLLRYWRESPK